MGREDIDMLEKSFCYSVGDCDACPFGKKCKHGKNGFAEFLKEHGFTDDAGGSVDTDVYDEREVHEDCTVEILRNSVTGKVSVGWYENE